MHHTQSSLRPQACCHVCTVGWINLHYQESYININNTNPCLAARLLPVQPLPLLPTANCHLAACNTLLTAFTGASTPAVQPPTVLPHSHHIVLADPHSLPLLISAYPPPPSCSLQHPADGFHRRQHPCQRTAHVDPCRRRHRDPSADQCEQTFCQQRGRAEDKMGLVRSRRRIDQDYAVPPTGRRKSSGDGGRDVHGRIDELRDRRLVHRFQQWRCR